MRVVCISKYVRLILNNNKCLHERAIVQNAQTTKRKYSTSNVSSPIPLYPEPDDMKKMVKLLSCLKRLFKGISCEVDQIICGD